ncbi:MAG: TlpA family protein disulfide reductase [Phycisphaeraceae bacterium]|nr:MAG: TlpA family protein disulfide reductase [Phycisphaeraceae bacterium]
MIRCVLTAACVACVVVPGPAPVMARASGFAAARAAAEDPAVEAGRRAMARAAAALSSLKSLDAAYEVEDVFEFDDGMNSDVTRTGRLRFERPGRVRVDGEDAAIVADGSTLRLAVGGDEKAVVSVPTPADAAGWERWFSERHELYAMDQVLLRVLVVDPPAPGAALFGGVKAITGSREEARGGKPGLRVNGTAHHDPSNPGEGEVGFSAWFDAATGLPGEWVLDRTEFMKKAREERAAIVFGEGDEQPPAVLKAVKATRIEIKAVDAPIAAGAFAGEFPGYAAKDRFTDVFAGMFDQQRALIGREAPDFRAKDLDGVEYSLNDLRGRVVVVDFWATWCAPCVKGMPALQRLQEEFAGEAVTVIGANMDKGAAPEKLRGWLEKRSITFRQALGAEGFAGSYAVKGIPHLVLIDAEGVVRDVKIGLKPGEGEELKANVRRLLKGEALATPAGTPETGVTNPRAEAEPAANEALARLTAEINPDRVREEKVGARVSVYDQWPRMLDLDGDGRSEFVAAEPDRMRVISADGRETRAVRLEGVRTNQPISVWHAGEVGGRTRFVTLTGRWNNQGAMLDATVWCHAADGALVWKHPLSVDEKTGARVLLTSGDLDGDGKGEAVALVNAYTTERFGRDSWMQKEAAAMLMVFGEDGSVRHSKRIGKSATAFFIAPADDQGPAAAVVLIDGRVQRFVLGGG